MKEVRNHESRFPTRCGVAIISFLLLHPCTSLLSPQLSSQGVKPSNRKFPTALLAFKSPEEIRSLAEKSALRKRGSKNFKKAWRNWLHLSVDSIRNELEQNLPHPVDENELEDLSFSLGVAADIGEMPNGFANSGARSGYALDYFCRARLLADFLIDNENPTLPDFWEDVKMNHALVGNGGEEFSRECNNLISLGGGPGFDFVAAALISSFNAGMHGEISPIKATILDYESGWSTLVNAMGNATNNILSSKEQMTCSWGGVCDITKPLDHPSNVACLAHINSTATIWTCQYCVAENAIALRDSDYVFFRNLFEKVPVGTVFIFSETTPRLWPEFYSLLLEECEKNKDIALNIGFPYKRGPLMVIQKNMKSSSPMINNKDLRALQAFEKYSEKHDQLMDTGWERQKSKKFSRRLLELQ